MSIVDAPFVGIAVPKDFSPISKAYWQSNASVEEIALRFSLKSGKQVAKRAGKAVLRGKPCKHCGHDIVVANRSEALSELNSHKERFNRIECKDCYRKERDRRFFGNLRKDRTAEKIVQAVPVAKAKVSKDPSKATKDEFYASWDWRTLRFKVLKEHGSACQCCGAATGDKDISGKRVRIVVDHIKPISKFWDLRLDRSNLQVLCEECNQGKGNWDETDFRPAKAPDEWIIKDDEVDPAILEQLSVHGETIQ